MKFENPQKINDLLGKEFLCDCGQIHKVEVDRIEVGAGSIKELPIVLEELGIENPLLVFDKNTQYIVKDVVLPLLQNKNTNVFKMRGENIEPDEYAIGQIALNFEDGVDGIIGVGSGVINDCCKLIAKMTDTPFVMIATAPSMDGYVSDTSSMISGGIKQSLQAPSAKAIIADTDIFKVAPEKLMKAGFGDMIAKYTALAEWHISNLINGEYYCPRIAKMVRFALEKCMINAPKLLLHDEAAANGVMEGLVLAGIAMSFAKSSRPASGLEHYFSHVWDMMALERNSKAELHGIQVGIGTYLTILLFENILKEQPDFSYARKRPESFDNAVWEKEMKEIFGKVSEQIIQKENDQYKKNDMELWEKRLDIIEENWEKIQKIIKEELPNSGDVKEVMEELNMPIMPKDIGVSKKDTARALIGSRDIRDKYLLSSMLWDLNLLDKKATWIEGLS